MTIQVGNLQDDVLLEIFDSYRQSFWNQLGSERVWNNKNGWFKLAHVCHNWRTVVLASPCRLRLRVYFASDTPTRAAALQSLSHLPIVVDYIDVVWSASSLKLLVSALGYPDRVCKIEVEGSHKYEQSAIISKALDISFPALESLRIHNIDGPKPTILLPPHLIASIQSLRRLQLDGPSIDPVPLEVLSVTTSLVDLNLDVSSMLSLNIASIFTHLQRLSRLRILQVSTQYSFPMGDKTPPTTTTLLSELTHLSLSAGYSDIEWFVARLVAPSLLELHILFYDVYDVDDVEDEQDDEQDHESPCESRTCIPGPNLSEFISAARVVFFAAQLAISHWTFQTSLFVQSLSIDDEPPSKIGTIKAESLARVSSPILATVEDIFLFSPDPIDFEELWDYDLATLGKSFEKIRGVKVLRLHHGLETEVADMLRQPTVDPLPAQEIDPGREATLDIFPSLKEIVVYPRTRDMPISEKERASVLESFGPFATARQQDGRPVKVFWDADGKVPRYFMTDSATWSDRC